MQVKVKKLSPDAKLPTYGTVGAACFDIYNVEDGFIEANDSKIFNTGLAFEIPEGHAMLVYSRSSHGFKDDIRLANCVGVIDSDYRGELKIKLTCDNQHMGDAMLKSERIAQAMIIPVQQVAFQEVEELSNTDRDTGGFGSTGK